MQNIQREKTQRLVVTAVMIALASVLSLIKVIQMPMGGSVTLLSMLPIAMLSIKYGVRWGMFASCVYVIVQIMMDLGSLMSWSMSVPVWFGCIIFDYILAFGSLGIAGIFRKNGIKGVCFGVTLALLMRLLCHVISGTIFFASWRLEGWNPFVYAVCYNGAFMLPELAITLVGAVVLSKTVVFKNMVALESK